MVHRRGRSHPFLVGADLNPPLSSALVKRTEGSEGTGHRSSGDTGTQAMTPRPIVASPPALGAASRPRLATPALPSPARHRSGRTLRLHGRAMPLTAPAAGDAAPRHADLAPPRL
uniref:Uncharacterized protein n=1 Tax=Oryza meridionalis TaxID=40149 RepID=A0A0E0FBP9_9ORYZ